MKGAVVVQKFGGSSVATPEKIGRVAQFIKESLESKERICVVVSAMGHSTNDLISLAHRINPHPPKREMDMLISCGERASMALLAMALAALDIKALSLTGSQSGIITDENHSGAKIVAIRPNRVLEAFKEFHVVIIAGFQGVSRNREITTLQRGGSDTTAVAMAAALNASACEIYTDVPGVMEADPRIVAKAQAIECLNHQQMSSMSLYGAKVLAHDAAIIAQELNVSLLVAETGSLQTGTVINEKAIQQAKKAILAMSHLRGVMRIKIDPKEAVLDKHNYFLCGGFKDGQCYAYASNDIAQELCSISTKDCGYALITLQIGDRSSLMKAVSLVINNLSSHKIGLIDIIVGFNEIFIIIDDQKLHESLHCLSELLLRDQL